MELRDLDERLQRLAEDERRRDKLTRDRRQAVAQIADLESQRRAWQDAVRAAGDELRDLEGVSLTGLFRSLLGDRQERIRDERERLVMARLRHDEVDAAIEPLRADAERMASELAELAGLDQERADLLAAKERLLTARGGETAARLLASASALGELSAQRREVDEAIAAARHALVELDAARADLAGARSWGTFDMLGGGLVTSLAKHGRIDAARRHAEKAQRHLRDLARELGDVAGLAGRGDGLGVDVGGFARFADLFFDGLIADWFVQSRVVSALDRVVATRRQVQDLVIALERRGVEIDRQRADAERERAAWIETVG